MNILIMTATITPKADVRSLGRKDPALRRKDYEDALWFYGRLVGQCIDQIVFVENSESDLSSLKAIAEQLNIVDKIEFISFAGLDYPQMYGRGYGELFLLDHAMANSRFIRECDADTPIWKMTGRYIVLNLAKLIQKTLPQKGGRHVHDGVDQSRLSPISPGQMQALRGDIRRRIPRKGAA
jgi:hypothetical protein